MKKLININQAATEKFDVIIVGSGMGGGTAALALAKSGVKVLLLEKGKANLDRKNLAGIEVEMTEPLDRLNNNRWPTSLASTIDGVETNFFAPLGCGLGGSTRLYAGALERLDPIDFSQQTMPNGSIVEWPYSYNDIETYYQEAENIFNVHGSSDPLQKDVRYNIKKSPALNATDQYFFDLFDKSGLHPYRLHLALSNDGDINGVLESCIHPAIKTGNLKIVENCEVTKIIASREKVSEILVYCMSQEVKIPVKRIILSGGAYFTPVLLLKSSNEHWPNGLVNDNDLVGRNLMFHASDFFSIWSKKKYSDNGAQKSIALRDYYCKNGEKLGQLQSVGRGAKFGNILYFLRQKLDTSIYSRIPVISKIIRQILRVPAIVAVLVFKDASIFASIIEDFPYKDNRVKYDPNKPSGLSFEYNIPKELRDRILNFRHLIKTNIQTRLIINFTQDITLNYGHPCGTCKAGNNPKTSIINSYGKAHSLANLYIADASFMPTSGGTNPSLTIAANSLRVVDGIINEINRAEAS